MSKHPQPADDWYIRRMEKQIQQVADAIDRETAKLQPKLLDETTRPVRVLALPSQPVEITWLDCYGNIIRVETRTFEVSE